MKKDDSVIFDIESPTGIGSLPSSNHGATAFIVFIIGAALFIAYRWNTIE
jgi:hypothetical protein